MPCLMLIYVHGELVQEIMRAVTRDRYLAAEKVAGLYGGKWEGEKLPISAEGQDVRSA